MFVVKLGIHYPQPECVCIGEVNVLEVRQHFVC